MHQSRAFLGWIVPRFGLCLLVWLIVPVLLPAMLHWDLAVNSHISPRFYAHTLNKLGFWPSVEVKGLADVITWRMMNLRSPELPDLEDKYQGRLRAERLGIPVPGLVGAWEHADDIPFEALPAQYVMKASHLAGAVAVMDDGRELIEDQELGTAELREMARGWLSRRYHSMQWAVWAIPKPMIMVEEMAMMHTSRGQWGGKGALDLKVLTVWGKVLLIYVATQDHGGTNYRMSVMLPTWNVTNFAFCDKGIKWLNGGTCDNSRLYGQPHEIPPPRPVGIERLVKDAERMAEGIDILRVDFLLLDDGTPPYTFNENTNYPFAGGKELVPEWLNREVAERWHRGRAERGLPKATFSWSGF